MVEGSHSGLVRLLGEQVYRKVPRVRIPLPPPFADADSVRPAFGRDIPQGIEGVVSPAVGGESPPLRQLGNKRVGWPAVFRGNFKPF